MIAGILSFQEYQESFKSFGLFQGADGDGELSFVPVEEGDFRGGFLLHPRLPYTGTDFFFADRANGLVVLMSGAVYNRASFAGNGDAHRSVPELVASLFLKEGPGFVSSLNGDFAIFIYNTGKSEAYLFRDHVGIRPVAWALKDQTLLFSSDILRFSALLSSGRVPGPEYLSGYFRYNDRRLTTCEGVNKLLPGHYLHFTRKGAERVRYWHPVAVREDKELTYEKVLNDLGWLLQDAVRIRCDRRFSPGAHVSSGIDSGIVALLARREYADREHFPGFSWSPEAFSPEGVTHDERCLVKEFCRNAGIAPRFSDFQPGDLVSAVSSLYGNPDLFYEGKTVCQAAVAGTNLLFSGWGGDEFISIADSGIDQDLLRGLHFRTFFRRNPVRNTRRFIINQLRYVIFPALGILEKSVRRSFRNDARYLKRGYRKSDRKAVATFYFHSSRRQVHLNMLNFYHLQKRCEDWAVTGYHHGVEYRFPLLDRRIIEYMLKVPSVLLCRVNRSRLLMSDLLESLMPGPSVFNPEKRDPVSMAYTWKMYKEAALVLMDEAAGWKDAPGLEMIDFALLEKDIRAYHSGSGRNTGMVLFRGLVHIKAVYEFTGRYRECQQGSC